MKKFVIFLIIFILIAIITGCTKNEKGTEENTPFDQKNSSLLAGQVQALSYSGFRDGQHPDRGDGAVFPSEKEILEDLKILSRNSNFNLIRVYDSQKNSQDVLRIIKENNINMKVMLGVWLSAEVSNHEGCPWLDEPIPQSELETNKIRNKNEIETAIKLANEYKDIIVAVNVGNEALVNWSDHLVTVDSVISYVKRVKGSVDQLVTVAENYEWWAQNGTGLAKEVDFIAIHTYPQWEERDIDQAMPYTIENVQQVLTAIPNKKIVISEAGWATVAAEFGERASEEKQKKYFNDLMAWAEKSKITVFFFEAFDENWKGNSDNPLGAEKHWGLFTADRKAKLAMYELYPDLIPAVDK